MRSFIFYFLTVGYLIQENTATAEFQKVESPSHPMQDGGMYPVQILMANTNKMPDVPSVRPALLVPGRTRARSLTGSMEMLDPKRHPKPKRPMGNDIGTARVLNPSTAKVLNPSLHHLSPPYSSDLTTQHRADDHLEATVSVGFTMSAINTSTPRKDEEAVVVSRELHDIMDAVPTLPAISIPHLQFQRDPEEEAINQRITQVARQLAESAMRRDYEEGKFGHIFSMPSATPEKIKSNATTTAPQLEKELTTNTDNLLTEPTAATIEPPTRKTGKLEKKGKSFIVSTTLPLVSHLPQEAAQLQLIAEVQQIPHFMAHEGFQPPTLSPELSGPLLGGPPLKPENFGERRSSKSIQVSKPESSSPLLGMRLPALLKFVSPKYDFKPDDLVVSIPVGGSFVPAIVSRADEWWPGKAIKEE